MFKKKSEKEDNKEKLKELLKQNLPRVFERQPQPAYAEGYLNELVEMIDAMY